jgi:hypothetical protein
MFRRHQGCDAPLRSFDLDEMKRGRGLAARRLLCKQAEEIAQLGA